MRLPYLDSLSGIEKFEDVARWRHGVFCATIAFSAARQRWSGKLPRFQPRSGNYNHHYCQYRCSSARNILAQMLRAKKDLRRAAAAKPSTCQVPKSKEPLPRQGAWLTRQIGFIAMDEQNCRHSCTNSCTHGCNQHSEVFQPFTSRAKPRVLSLRRDSHPGLRSSGTSPQTFRIKVKGRGGQWKIAGERYSILVNLASLVLPVYLSISDEQHFCFNLSARGAGCVSAMWIDSPAHSRPLSEVYAFARHYRLWRHQ
jgi:hypothetical protein